MHFSENLLGKIARNFFVENRILNKRAINRGQKIQFYEIFEQICHHQESEKPFQILFWVNLLQSMHF